MESSSDTDLDQVDSTLALWRDAEITALDLLRIVGELRFNRSIDLVLFREDIYDSNPSGLIRRHGHSNSYSIQDLSIRTTYEVALAISKLENLPPYRLDIGTLGIQYLSLEDKSVDVSSFVLQKLGHLIDKSPKNQGQKDVVLYGFGRMGRLEARRIVETTGKGEQLRLKAIVIRPKLSDKYEEASKRAALFASDSVHGDFGGTLEVSESGEELIINGNRVRLIYAKLPEEIDYTVYGIQDALVIDNTGVWRDREGLSMHLRPGIDSVMLTAPAKGDVPNIVYGVNESICDFEKEKVFSAASCTTNAIVPVLKVVHDALTIEKGHVETIHSYTNDQNLIDNFHKKPRRGRGAPINMVLTSTGAASAVAKVLPDLAGKLSGNAIRVPTPNISMAILNLTLEKNTSVDEINQLLRDAALYGDLVEQIRYSDSTEFVSSNAIGMTSALVVDAPSTIVSNDGKTVVLYLWYDNEYGYTCQVVRLAKHASKVRRYIYY